MLEEKVYIRALLLHYWKKGLSAAAASKEICAVEGEDTIAERTGFLMVSKLHKTNNKNQKTQSPTKSIKKTARTFELT